MCLPPLLQVALSALSAAVVAQDGLYQQGGLQFLPAQQDAGGLPLLQFGQDNNPFLLGDPSAAAGGFQLQDPGQLQQQQQQQQQQLDPQRTGPLTFGPEHARPATTTPNPFRQGPLSQAALQQQHALAQLQQQQQAFATQPAPSVRYASLPPQPPQPQQQQQPQQLPPSGFGGFGGFGTFFPSAPGAAFGPLPLAPAPAAPGQDGASSYTFNQ
ncbi:E3 ubiquitin-protein ligase RNF216 [Frankliniella fusca]|uniref:E3 ubiquitin-protein ligase RNF216 n=1 Tax=Frankliniella fusca TaxID=407009 RepID=A0AAE1H1F5_9NEOP|nr:E3 ubiquitin-protein ligase RNF216 [Frankliniella fusca]